MIRKWKTLSEKDVSPSRWFPVFRQRVRLPDGKVLDDYYVSRLNDSAMIVPVTDSGKIVFVRQYKQGVGRVVIELPAGFSDRDESPVKCAGRELLEETGYEVKRLVNLGALISNPSKAGAKTHCFLASGLTQRGQNLDDNEEIEVLEIPAKQVYNMIRSGKINCCETISALVLAKRYIRDLL